MAKSERVVRAAVKVRNQAEAIIATYHGTSTSFALNGERELVRRCRSFARTCVDVGAHEGTWTQMVIEELPAARVTCYEPHPVSVAAMRGSLARLQPEVARRAVVVEAALGAVNGRGVLFEHPLSRQLARIQAIDGGPIEIRTLDGEAERLGLTVIDILKIDAEGYDLHVLRGATNMLAQHAIGCVQFEYGDQWPSTSSTLAGAIALFAQHGYECFLLRPSALVPVHYDVFGEHFRYSNYVAVAPHVVSSLGGWISERSGSGHARKSAARR